MKERKEIKPVNITKIDVNYRQFLKLLMKVKPKQDFLRSGVTEKELEEIISPFYKSLNDKRLAGYRAWVRTNKLRIQLDMKKLKKDSTAVIAPDNAVKAETFDSFVEVIRGLKKSGVTNFMGDHEAIAKNLFKTGAKKKLMYVKNYIRKNSNDLQNKIDDLSSAETENDEEAVDDSSSEDSDKSESPKNIEKDEDISEMDKRFESMDTSDSHLSKKIFEDFSNNVGHSTPKSSRSPSSRSPSSPDNMEVDVLPHQKPRKIENDSGFDSMNRAPSGYSADISDENAQGDGDSQNARSERDMPDLSTNNAENQNKTGALLEVAYDAITEDCSDDDHRPTAARVESGLSRSTSHSDDAYNRSSLSRSSEKTPKRSIASIQDENNSNSITEKSAASNDQEKTNSSTWISMSRVEYSPANIHGRRSSDENTSSKSKGFKSTLLTSAGHENVNEQDSTPSSARKNTGSSSSRKHDSTTTSASGREIDPVFPGGDFQSNNDRTHSKSHDRQNDTLVSLENTNNTGPTLEVSSGAVAEDCSDDDHRPKAASHSDDAYNRSSLSRSSEKTPKRSIASIQDENNSNSISPWISMSRVEYSPVNIHGRSGSGGSTDPRSKRFKSTPSSAGNASFNQHVSTPGRKNTSSSTSGRETDPFLSAGDFQSNSDRTWNSHKYLDISSAIVRGNNTDGERSVSKTALTRIDTNSSIRIEKSSSSVADEDSGNPPNIRENDISVTADESYYTVSSKENLGRDPRSSHSETSE